MVDSALNTGLRIGETRPAVNVRSARMDHDSLQALRHVPGF